MGFSSKILPQTEGRNLSNLNVLSTLEQSWLTAFPQKLIERLDNTTYHNVCISAELNCGPGKEYVLAFDEAIAVLFLTAK